MFEILDENTAIIYYNEPKEIIKAASTLVDDELTSCSITSVEVFDEILPVLSFKRKSSDKNIEIILLKTAEDKPGEEPDPVESEGEEAVVEEEVPVEEKGAVNDISELLQQRPIILENLSNVTSSIEDLETAYYEVYTGRDVGIGEEELKDWLPNIPPGKRHPSKGYIGIDYMPGMSDAEGVSMPWVVIDRSPGKGNPRILKRFPTEDEAREYYEKAVTPGTGPSGRIKDLRQRNLFLKRLKEQAKKLEDPVAAKKEYEANIRALNKFDKLIHRITSAVKQKDLLSKAKYDDDTFAAAQQLYNFASIIGIRLEDLMSRNVPSIKQLQAIMNGIAADAENIVLLDVSDLMFETEVTEDESQPLRGKIIAPQSREEMLEFVEKVTPKKKLKTV